MAYRSNRKRTVQAINKKSAANKSFVQDYTEGISAQKESLQNLKDLNKKIKMLDRVQSSMELLPFIKRYNQSIADGNVSSNVLQTDLLNTYFSSNHLTSRFYKDKEDGE